MGGLSAAEVAVGRFAPSTTGPAHPGTLFAALLCWLDIRALGGRLVLRLEDLDPVRCRPAFADDLRRALEWLAIDWDAEELQSEFRGRHDRALDRLARAGRLYACRCSRTDIRTAGGTTADGTPRYPGTCRERVVTASTWRDTREPLRLLVTEFEDARDEDGRVWPRHAAGDPLVRRRDGAVAYHLAGVVDDAARGVTRIVRGRDLAASTSVQNAIRSLLAEPAPSYRHHCLLLERAGEKLAKFHGSVSWEALRRVADGGAIRRQLLEIAGLAPDTTPAEFRWDAVSSRDRVVRWEPPRLVWAEARD